MKRRFLWTLAVLALMCGVALTQAKTATGGTEQALKDMETKWAAAFLKGDTVAIGDILADDFVRVSPEGKVQSKADVLSETKKSKITQSTVSDMRVRMLSNDAALISGKWSGVGADAMGKKFDSTERWTDVFVKKDGKWKCVWSHITTIAK